MSSIKIKNKLIDINLYLGNPFVYKTEIKSHLIDFN